jgi:hypothetical protein
MESPEQGSARRVILTIPEVAFIAATRGVLGFGMGLLLSDRIGGTRRRTVGWTLVAVGAVATVPAAMKVFGARGAASVTAR